MKEIQNLNKSGRIHMEENEPETKRKNLIEGENLTKKELQRLLNLILRSEDYQ